MRITVRIVGVIGEPASKPTRVLEVEGGATVSDLLGRLDDSVRAVLFQPYVLVVVNGRRVDQAAAARLVLRDGDTVAVVAATAGG